MNLKTKLNKFLYPPVWLMILLTVLSTAALITVFTRAMDTHPLAYVTYLLSFYTLSVIVLRCIKVLPGKYRAAKQKVYDHPVGVRLMTDMPFRTQLSLYVSLATGILYAAVNLFAGIFYASVWSVTIAVYYLILVMVRLIPASYVKRNAIGSDRLGELSRARSCAGILMTLNLALSGVVVLVILENKSFTYNGILIYAMALYTFYITTLAVINLVKYKKYKSPVMSTVRIINLASALVSMLTLETAMLSQFGADTDSFTKTVLIAATGAGVSIAVVTMSVYSLIKTTKEIATYKK